APNATKHLMLDINLDAREKPLEMEFDLNRPEATSNFSNTTTMYDSYGGAHQMTMYFRRLEDTEGVSWEWHATVDGSEVIDPDDFKMKEIGNGIVRFDQQGNLLEEITEFSEVNFKGGAAAGQVINFDFGKNISEEGG